jgi:hypothetical protein
MGFVGPKNMVMVFHWGRKEPAALAAVVGEDGSHLGAAGTGLEK